MGGGGNGAMKKKETIFELRGKYDPNYAEAQRKRQQDENRSEASQ